MNKEDQLEGVQKRFLSLPRDPWLVRTKGSAESKLSDNIKEAVAKIEHGPWHWIGDAQELRDGFLLLAGLAARLAGYSGSRPVTYWLNRVLREGQCGDVRGACARECERVLIDDLAPRAETGVNQAAANIRYLRMQLGLSQGKLADRLGVDKRRISEHETGESIPSPRYREYYIQLFSSVLGRTLSIQQLLESDLTREESASEAHQKSLTQMPPQALA